MGTEPDQDRKAVKTYVPAYQKEEWTARANDLDMTQSEFVRVMVQAGIHTYEQINPQTNSEDKKMTLNDFQENNQGDS